MARSSDINQRIVLTGADEVRRHLESIAASGQRAGNTTRAALIAATSGANSFTAGTKAAGASSGQLRSALQNLSFQVNDVATSLASGGDVARVFAQQGGQIFQAFQQGGGLGTVLGAAGAAIRSFITPTTAAVAALAALGVEFALVVARAASAEESARKFDVILKAMGKTGETTGKDLEAAAHTLRDVGLSTAEAREQFTKFIQAGGRGNLAPQVARIGAELEAVLGKGSMEKFVAAAAEGGPALEDFAKKLGVIPKVAVDTSAQLEAAAQSTRKFTASFNDAITSRNRSIADEQRNARQTIADLTRKRGTAEEEAQLASSRRILEIRRESSQAINDLIAQRNAENAAQLAVYNKQIEEAAQKSVANVSLIQQIGQKVFGSFQASLTPTQSAILALSTAWNDLQDTFAKSGFITQIIADLTSLVTSIKEAITFVERLAAAISQVPGLSGGAIPAAFRSDATLGQRIFSAEGGLIRGPGTGTSDSIPAQLSNGEFVVNALATRMNLPLLQAMNAMGRSIMPRMRMPRGFAAGGLVAAGAGGGGAPVHLHLGGSTFQLMGDRGVVSALTRVARKSAMLSAGRKPSTA